MAGDESGESSPLSREEWIVFLLGQAPEITAEQWAAIVEDLRALRLARGCGRDRPPKPPGGSKRRPARGPKQ